MKKKKIKKYLKHHKEHPEFAPKKSRNLKAVSFETYIPIDNSLLTQCTEWDNGEGFDISFTWNKGKDSFISLHLNEIEALLACLYDLNYFGD